MRKLVLVLISIYQKISFLFGTVCRFTPTCSRYTYQAVEKFGVIKGLALGFKRISRCHPWNKGGYDPVP